MWEKTTSKVILNFVSTFYVKNKYCIFLLWQYLTFHSWGRKSSACFASVSTCKLESFTFLLKNFSLLVFYFSLKVLHFVWYILQVIRYSWWFWPTGKNDAYKQYLKFLENSTIKIKRILSGGKAISNLKQKFRSRKIWENTCFMKLFHYLLTDWFFQVEIIMVLIRFPQKQRDVLKYYDVLASVFLSRSQLLLEPQILGSLQLGAFGRIEV